MTLAGLNSLRQKEYQILMKNLIFDNLFHKKRLVVVIWVLGMIKPSGSVDFLMKWGCWGHWGHWGCWGCRGHWGCRGFKAWKITIEDFRVILVLEFNNLRTKIISFWCFEKKIFRQNHENPFWILAPFLSEAVEASLCDFFKNWLVKLKFPNLRNIQIPSNKI